MAARAIGRVEVVGQTGPHAGEQVDAVGPGRAGDGGTPAGEAGDGALEDLGLPLPVRPVVVGKQREPDGHRVDPVARRTETKTRLPSDLDIFVPLYASIPECT